MSDDSIEQLSPREIEIIELVATGATNQQVAQDLTISVNTVKAHLRNIYAKLNVESRTEATLCAIQQGLITVETPEDSSTPDEAETPEPTLPAPQSLAWALPLSQRLALVVVLVLVLSVAFWPDPQAAPAVRNSPFVDLPANEGPGSETGRTSLWQRASQMTAPRSRFAQTQVNGTIYIISGLTPDGWSGEVEAYDPTTNRWQNRAAKPVAVANAAAAVVGERVYVPGGLDQTNAARRILEVYDPAADAWMSASPPPVALHSYAIAPVAGGFYLFGGFDGQAYLDTVYVYDAAADAWQQVGSLRVARAFAAAATMEDRIYLVGGYDGDTEYSLCESYDLTAAAEGRNPWRTHTPMSTGRAGHSMLAAEGSLYVVGGGLDSYLSHNERYDTKNNVWSNFESPYVGEWRTLGLSIVESTRNVSLYAIGGWNGDYVGTVQSYPIRFNTYLPLQ
jgi:DNA-binding CsgD family transcriptional regulator